MRRESEYLGGQSRFIVEVPYDDVEVNDVDSGIDLYRSAGDGYERVYPRKKFLKVARKTELTVQVDLFVEKESYDEAADQCQYAVNELTGSIAAVQSHQINEIKKSGRRIAKTISDGFYGLVKSEISQQMVELEKRAESLGGKLMELSGLLEKQRQVMEDDYASISGRYIKIFSGLDEDCDHRIRALDKHAFEIKAVSDSLGAQCMSAAGSVGTMLDAAENPKLQAQLTSSSMRRRIQDSIGCISTILNQEQAYEKYLGAVTHKAVVDSTYDFAPVMTMSSVSLDEEQDVVNVYTADAFSNELKNIMSKAVLNQVDLDKQTISVEDKERLNECFYAESEKWMSQADADEDDKSKRVHEMLNKMWQENQLG